uniref:G_PROTEIN_RECEP_F1_2 domain-containing protein n=1 Tax=Caenorhabditis tropicalis TaxID=1561998 RepID=A0A1I7UKW5_9PELO
MLIVFLVVLQLEVLVSCFERKHQAIAKTLNYHVLPDWFVNSAYSACVACPIVITGWFHTIHLDKDEQWRLIEENYPEYLSDFQTLTHFDVYTKTLWFILLLLCTIGGGLGLLLLFLIFITDVFRMMVLLKIKISAHRYKKHREAIQSLLVQFAMSSFCLVPPCCLAIIIILELDQAQLLTELCIAVFAMHSSANMVSLLIFFPPYRNFVLRRLKIQKLKIRPGGKNSVSIQPSPQIKRASSFADVS